MKYFKYISMLNQDTMYQAEQRGKQGEIQSLHVKDGEETCQSWEGVM